MCTVSNSYDLWIDVSVIGDKGRTEEEEEEVSIKIKKRTKIRGVPGCWPEHLIIIRTSIHIKSVLLIFVFVCFLVCGCAHSGLKIQCYKILI